MNDSINDRGDGDSEQVIDKELLEHMRNVARPEEVKASEGFEPYNFQKDEEEGYKDSNSVVITNTLG